MSAVQCLGEGEYTALIRRRRTRLGPSRIIGELPLTYGNWARRLNSTSTASVTVPTSGAGSIACCEVLNAIDPPRDHLELYRDGEGVWLGPCRDASSVPESDEAVVPASDLSVWASWRVFTHTMKPRGIDLSVIFKAYLDYAFNGILPPWGVVQAGDPPLSWYEDNPGIDVFPSLVGITGDRTVSHHDLKYVANELEELARTGVDWTVTNGTWWVGGMVIMDEGTRRPITLPGYLTDEDFRTLPKIRRSADSMVTNPWLRGNNVHVNVGGPDPQDGVLIQRVLDEYSIEDEGSGRAAAQTYYDRAHEPLLYVEGNNALEPGAPLDIQQLIPGILVNVDLSGGGCIPYTGPLRLESIDVNFNADTGEEITVALQPQGTSQDARGEG